MRDFETNEDFLNFFNRDIFDVKKNTISKLKSDFSEKIFCDNSEEKINFEISKIIETSFSDG